MQQDSCRGITPVAAYRVLWMLLDLAEAMLDVPSKRLTVIIGQQCCLGSPFPCTQPLQVNWIRPIIGVCFKTKTVL